MERNTDKITNKITEVFDTLADEFFTIHNLQNNYNTNSGKMEISKALAMCQLAKQIVNSADILVRADRLAIDGSSVTEIKTNDVKAIENK